MDDLATTVERLAARVQQLEDEREVTRVVLRYGFAVDLGDADATAALYTDDTVIDLGPTSRFEGAGAARTIVADERHQAIVGRCAHTVGPIVVDVDGDRATATGYMRVYVADVENGGVELWRMSFTTLTLVRSSATWRIAERTSRVLGAEHAPELLRNGL
jgi:ketosteroid isomerase-like protein